jgi:hypothetical protein
MYKNENAYWTPYLVPDTNVLCEDLKLIQDLARCNKFIIIISLVGKLNQGNFLNTAYPPLLTHRPHLNFSCFKRGYFTRNTFWKILNGRNPNDWVFYMPSTGWLWKYPRLKES